jgi:hypothetical protein
VLDNDFFSGGAVVIVSRINKFVERVGAALDVVVVFARVGLLPSASRILFTTPAPRQRPLLPPPGRLRDTPRRSRHVPPPEHGGQHQSDTIHHHRGEEELPVAVEVGL